MSVKLSSDESRSSSSEHDLADWVTSGEEYQVLEIFVEAGGPAHLRLVPDEPTTPAFFPAILFEVADGSLSGDWTAAVDERSGLLIGPPALQVAGFWECYFEGDREAVDVYQRMVRQ